MPVRRWDAGETTGKPVRLPNGWLRVPARLTRVGVFTYLNADGSTRRELRHPDEVFAADSLASLEMVPVTDGHPPKGEPLDSDNTSELSRGHLGERIDVEDQRYLRGSMLLTDSALIDKVERGEQRQTSCGYFCELDKTPGEWAGERYDGVQRKIRYNHVAVLREGRAGRDVGLRLDGENAAMIQPAERPAEEPPMKIKLVVDGREQEIDEKDLPAVLAKIQARADSADAEKARADAAEAAKVALQARVDAASAAEGKRRLAEFKLEAGKILGKDPRLDAAGDARAVKAAVAEKVLGLKCDGKPDAYVDALYEAAVKAHGDSGLAGARKRLDEGEGDDAGGEGGDDADEEYAEDGLPEKIDAEQGRVDMMDRSAGAWREPVRFKVPAAAGE